MQDMHHIAAGGGGGGGGGGGRYFGGGDRRLRPHNHQALKCPRCDSLNTKFCYYNNYNLSQPRHFCKSCRRYWTKGGVLRNVPVGGGCRKAKRSKHKSSNAAADGDGTRDRSSNAAQSSSSESSSLTASTTTPTSTAAVAAADDGSAPSNPPPPVFNFADTRFITSNPSFDPSPIMNTSTDGQIFASESFASMMTSPPEMMAFGVTDIPTTSYGRGQQGNQPSAPESNTAAPPLVVEEFKMQEVNDGGLAAALGWGSGGGGGGDGCGDQGLFDLSAAVDPAYWSQSQWTDSDNQSLNFLP